MSSRKKTLIIFLSGILLGMLIVEIAWFLWQRGQKLPTPALPPTVEGAASVRKCGECKKDYKCVEI